MLSSPHVRITAFGQLSSVCFHRSALPPSRGSGDRAPWTKQPKQLVAANHQVRHRCLDAFRALSAQKKRNQNRRRLSETGVVAILCSQIPATDSPLGHASSSERTMQSVSNSVRLSSIASARSPVAAFHVVRARMAHPETVYVACFRRGAVS